MLYKFLVVFSLAMLSLSNMVEGADFRLKPFLAVSEEYNDNMLLTNENRVDDFITRVQPGFDFGYEAPFWKWDVGYLLDYRYYAERTLGDEVTHDLGAKGHINVIRDGFFIDLKDEYQRVTLDVTRDFTRESLVVNQSDRNIFTVNPNFKLRLAPTVYITPGYIYRNVWYKDERGTDKTNNVAYATINKEISARTTFSAGYRYTREDTDFKDFARHDAFGKARYEYAEESYLYFSAGNTWVDIEDGDSFSQYFWDGGITHSFAAARITVESSRTYDENPRGTSLRVNKYMVSLESERERTSLGLSAALRDYRDTVTDTLQTERYGGWGHVKYLLTPRTSGRVDFYVEKIEDERSLSDPTRYSAAIRLDYLLLEHFLFGVSYQHAESDSDIDTDDYEVNRVMAEIKATL